MVELITTNFDFLEGVNNKLFGYAEKMEKYTYEDEGSASKYQSRFLEEIIILICEEKGVHDDPNKHNNNNSRINKLKNFHAINYELKEDLFSANSLRNEGIHDDPPLQDILKLNRLLFNIAREYMKIKDPDFIPPEYVEITISDIVGKHKKSNNAVEEGKTDLILERLEKIEEDAKKTSKLFEELSNNPIQNSGLEEEDSLESEEVFVGDSVEIEELFHNLPEDYVFKQREGSFLLNELSKLSIFSKESVDDGSELNYFKDYLHIDRDIQKEFKSKLEDANGVDSSQLILLAGSVGDGKSHLLSYMNSKYPELMKNFKVHPDATVSFSPNKNYNAILTLLDVLKPFNDKNYSNEKTKQIICINLGILTELMDNETFKSDFKKLGDLIKSSDIFNSSNYTEGANDFLSVINFSNYHFFELNEDGFSSNFLNGLFDKIISPSMDNPFYVAYKKDLKNNIFSPIIKNYEFLSENGVKDIIINILTRHIIENKLLVSVRDFYNLIYEIIVPSQIKNYDEFDVMSYIFDLLPTLFFNSFGRSFLLNSIANENPFNIRSKVLDEFLTSLDTIDDSFFDKFFNNHKNIMFIKNFLMTDEYQNLSLKDKQLFKDNLMYFAVFFGNNNIKSSLNDEYFDDFAKNVYYYNNSPKTLKTLFKKLKDAIFKWKGSIKKGVILIDLLDNFEVGKSLRINYKPDNAFNTDSKNKYKNYIRFHCLLDSEKCKEECSNSCNLKKCVKLDMDYNLYKLIIKMDEGYKPNKIEKQKLVVFTDFIDNIISKSNKSNILINYTRGDILFSFEKDDLGDYIFEEEE